MKVGTLVVLTENIGRGCQTVFAGTICQIAEELDENHVKLHITPDGSSVRNANICRFRSISEEEVGSATEAFKYANLFHYATID